MIYNDISIIKALEQRVLLGVQVFIMLTNVSEKSKLDLLDNQILKERVYFYHTPSKGDLGKELLRIFDYDMSAMLALAFFEKKKVDSFLFSDTDRYKYNLGKSCRRVSVFIPRKWKRSLGEKFDDCCIGVLSSGGYKSTKQYHMNSVYTARDALSTMFEAMQNIATKF